LRRLPAGRTWGDPCRLEAGVAAAWKAALRTGNRPLATGNWLLATGHSWNRAGRLHCCARMGNLLWVIIVVLIILWLVGFVAFPVGGNLIHILLVIALILVIYRLATGRRVL
ncbi:MAG: lmo0937 family membrane protein, partial [Thermoanaerobaculia bacterium]